MVTKMSAPGRSFKGVADYCLHDRWVPGQGHPESAERVEWTETRNLATEHGERAARIMAAPAEASPELKRLAGGAATGRKLEKPVCHYSLNWAKDEKPDRQEMSRAAAESLKALGMERHQALIVSHRDGQPHVHVIANRVDPESGKAAGLSRSQLKLSKWAERYGREQGKIRCLARERNNRRREAAEQAGVVGALRASRAAEGAAGKRLPWGVRPVSGLAGAGRQTARDRRDDPGTHGSDGALSGGAGGPATVGAGFAWESAFRSGAGNREQGGRSLP